MVNPLGKARTRAVKKLKCFTVSKTYTMNTAAMLAQVQMQHKLLKQDRYDRVKCVQKLMASKPHGTSSIASYVIKCKGWNQTDRAAEARLLHKVQEVGITTPEAHALLEDAIGTLAQQSVTETAEFNRRMQRTL